LHVHRRRGCIQHRTMAVRWTRILVCVAVNNV
jgi:hypothetical protein